MVLPLLGVATMLHTFRYDYADRRDDRITGRLAVQAANDRDALTRATELADKLSVTLIRLVDPGE